jgi:hypothetical protein
VTLERAADFLLGWGTGCMTIIFTIALLMQYDAWLKRRK